MNDVIIAGIFAALLCVMSLCLISYLAGHKKGVEEVVAFHNGIWREAERRMKGDELQWCLCVCRKRKCKSCNNNR